MKDESPKAGHNSDRFDNVAATRIRSTLDRVSKLTEEKQAIQEDIKDVYAEAKGIGLDVKVLRKLHKLESMDGEKRREMEELEDLYKAAIGMI